MKEELDNYLRTVDLASKFEGKNVSMVTIIKQVFEDAYMLGAKSTLYLVTYDEQDNDSNN